MLHNICSLTSYVPQEFLEDCYTSGLKPYIADVRDVARAHIRAAEVPSHILPLDDVQLTGVFVFTKLTHARQAHTCKESLAAIALPSPDSGPVVITPLIMQCNGLGVLHV